MKSFSDKTNIGENNPLKTVYRMNFYLLFLLIGSLSILVNRFIVDTWINTSLLPTEQNDLGYSEKLSRRDDYRSEYR